MNINAHIRSAKKRGVKFIVIDPRKTEMARFADIFIQPRPGHDTGLFAALIRLVLDNGWHNKAFCERYVSGLDELRAAVAPFTPEHAAAAAGVDPQLLIDAAAMLGAAKKACIGSGTGHNMAAFSNTSEHLSEALNAILGGYVLAGDVIPNPGIFYRRPEVEMVAPPNRTWEQEPKCRSADYGLLMGEFPASVLPDEILMPGKDKIRAMFVVGANPMIHDLIEDAIVACDGMIEIPEQLSQAAGFVPQQRRLFEHIGAYPREVPAFSAGRKEVPGQIDPWPGSGRCPRPPDARQGRTPAGSP
ncbi:MAG: molybdopterin-dependent oxidoreductase [Akkermansiaceae bacterium]|nr:molybdopterin-dependent oxidoreductase [Akkermansiaceae bacterium]